MLSGGGEVSSAPSGVGNVAPSSRNFENVGVSAPNYFGIYDLHGLIWEWVADFNSVFVSGDNREDSDSKNDLFCGDGAVSATDRANYAAFMRYALRNSLRGSYSTQNLGFRCAYDATSDN